MQILEKILSEIDDLIVHSAWPNMNLVEKGKVEEIIRSYMTDVPVTNNRWIPVKDHLPEERFLKVYVTTYYYHIRSVRKAIWNNGRFEFGNGIKIQMKILAWMPRIPAPYQPKVCVAKDCPYNKGTVCPARKGCGGYEEEKNGEI